MEGARGGEHLGPHIARDLPGLAVRARPLRELHLPGPRRHHLGAAGRRWTGQPRQRGAAGHARGLQRHRRLGRPRPDLWPPPRLPEEPPHRAVPSPGLGRLAELRAFLGHSDLRRRPGRRRVGAARRPLAAGGAYPLHPDGEHRPDVLAHLRGHRPSSRRGDAQRGVEDLGHGRDQPRPLAHRRRVRGDRGRAPLEAPRREGGPGRAPHADRRGGSLELRGPLHRGHDRATGLAPPREDARGDRPPRHPGRGAPRHAEGWAPAARGRRHPLLRGDRPRPRRPPPTRSRLGAAQRRRGLPVEQPRGPAPQARPRGSIRATQLDPHRPRGAGRMGRRGVHRGAETGVAAGRRRRPGLGLALPWAAASRRRALVRGICELHDFP
mmetsp:Transcript_51935/g.151317  ORF Transcript_51935/g.151317 Transcript_51935/m.151317 type:complete len:381 (+) Transcript_51935:448-1590(+)